MSKSWPALGRSATGTENKIRQDNINKTIITLNLLNRELMPREE
jgi:hypothetical protein